MKHLQRFAATTLLIWLFALCYNATEAALIAAGYCREAGSMIIFLIIFITFFYLGFRHSWKQSDAWHQKNREKNRAAAAGAAVGVVAATVDIIKDGK